MPTALPLLKVSKASRELRGPKVSKASKDGRVSKAPSEQARRVLKAPLELPRRVLLEPKVQQEQVRRARRVLKVRRDPTLTLLSRHQLLPVEAPAMSGINTKHAYFST